MDAQRAEKRLDAARDGNEVARLGRERQTAQGAAAPFLHVHVAPVLEQSAENELDAAAAGNVDRVVIVEREVPQAADAGDLDRCAVRVHVEHVADELQAAALWNRRAVVRVERQVAQGTQRDFLDARVDHVLAHGDEQKLDAARVGNRHAVHIVHGHVSQCGARAHAHGRVALVPPQRFHDLVNAAQLGNDGTALRAECQACERVAAGTLHVGAGEVRAQGAEDERDALGGDEGQRGAVRVAQQLHDQVGEDGAREPLDVGVVRVPRQAREHDGHGAVAGQVAAQVRHVALNGPQRREAGLVDDDFVRVAHGLENGRDAVLLYNGHLVARHDGEHVEHLQGHETDGRDGRADVLAQDETDDAVEADVDVEGQRALDDVLALVGIVLDKALHGLEDERVECIVIVPVATCHMPPLLVLERRAQRVHGPLKLVVGKQEARVDRHGPAPNLLDRARVRLVEQLVAWTARGKVGMRRLEPVDARRVAHGPVRVRIVAVLVPDELGGAVPRLVLGRQGLAARAARPRPRLARRIRALDHHGRADKRERGGRWGARRARGCSGGRRPGDAAGRKHNAVGNSRVGRDGRKKRLVLSQVLERQPRRGRRRRHHARLRASARSRRHAAFSWLRNPIMFRVSGVRRLFAAAATTPNKFDTVLIANRGEVGRRARRAPCTV